MARDRDAAADAERYPAEGDVTGAGRRPDDERRVGERLADGPVRGEPVHRSEDGAGPLRGEAGAGREGLTGDDRTPRDGVDAHSGAAAAGTTGTSAAGTGRTGSGTAETGIPGRGTTDAGVHEAGTHQARTPEGGTLGTDAARAGAPGTDTARADAPGTGATAVGAAEGAGVADRRESGSGVRGDEALGVPGARDRTSGDGPAAPVPDGVTRGGAKTADGVASGTGHLGSAAARTGDTGRPGTGGKDSGSRTPLLAHEEAEKWEAQLRQTLAGFVEEPRSAVEEADRTLEEIAARFGEAVTRRRRSLRMSWQNGEEGGPGHGTDTEQLRLALRDYRELADRLLHL
ncbi:hypothetical protein [Streptomyces sp. NPDC001675]